MIPSPARIRAGLDPCWGRLLRSPVVAADIEAIRLSRAYDIARLRADLDGLDDVARVPQPDRTNLDGAWTGIPLHAKGGRADIASGPRPGLEPYQETEFLRRCPYVREILQELDCPKTVVRFLALAPGARIAEHDDKTVLSFQTGQLRLHIPIVTHPDVEFMLDGKRQHWQAGELWWGDFARRHSVANRSPITRVHLVIDVLITPSVLSLFPAPYVDWQRERGIVLHTDRVGQPQSVDPQSFIFDFDIPPGAVPIFPNGAACAIGLVDGRLKVLVNHEPYTALEPISADALAIVGMPPGTSIECSRRGSQVVDASLVLGALRIPLTVRPR